MSDIPVGSPPVPPGRHAAPGGWYPDPTDQQQERYWDGWQWSRNTRPAENATQRQPQAGPPGPQQGNPQWGPQQSNQQWGPQGNQQPGPPPYPQQFQAPVRAPVPATQDGVPLAGWWLRGLATMIDFLAISLLAAIPSFPIQSRIIDQLTVVFEETLAAANAGQQPPDFVATDLISLQDQFLLGLILSGVGFLYLVLFWRFKGATPGKMICGLRVVAVDQGQSNAKVGWGPLALRGLVWCVPGLIPYMIIFQVLDVLFPLWQPKRQAIHDLAAKTQVVRRR